MEENPTYVVQLSNGTASKRLTKVEMINFLEDNVDNTIEKVTVLRKYEGGDVGGPAKRLAQKQAYEQKKAVEAQVVV